MAGRISFVKISGEDHKQALSLPCRCGRREPSARFQMIANPRTKKGMRALEIWAHALCLRKLGLRGGLKVRAGCAKMAGPSPIMTRNETAADASILENP